MGSSVVRVLFDTTVLCAAIRNPRGLNMGLLKLALVGLIEPVITQEVVAEWVGNCRAGLGGVAITEEDLDAFCDLMEPMLSEPMIARVRMGRAMGPLEPITETAGALIIQAPIGHEQQTQVINDQVLALKDPHDRHIVVAALQDACDCICTANTRDFPDGMRFNKLEFITPKRLYHALLAAP